jgi:hypothetical protein
MNFSVGVPRRLIDFSPSLERELFCRESANLFLSPLSASGENCLLIETLAESFDLHQRSISTTFPVAESQSRRRVVKSLETVKMNVPIPPINLPPPYSNEMTPANPSRTTSTYQTTANTNLPDTAGMLSRALGTPNTTINLNNSSHVTIG